MNAYTITINNIGIGKRDKFTIMFEKVDSFIEASRLNVTRKEMVYALSRFLEEKNE